MIRYKSIRIVHPTVVELIGDADARDIDGNSVVLDESKISVEMDRLQAEYDAQDYARKRKAEYPSIEELVVALYDTDDKAAIEAKRAEVKAKYPKS
jgi:hypothetical protein